MINLTKITTPFGLLDEETQEALRRHGGPYEWYAPSGTWSDAPCPNWGCNYTYRVKSIPREWWVHPLNRKVISYNPNDRHDTAWVRVREVLE